MYRCGQSNCRRGVQLLELMVSLTTSSLLVAGIAVSLFLSSSSRDLIQQEQDQSSQLSAGMSRLLNDLTEAQSITLVSPENMYVLVGDRNNDATDEYIEYRWDGSGNPLQYIDPDSQAWDITPELSSFQMEARSAAPQVRQSSNSLDPPNQFLYQSYTQNSSGDGSFLNPGSGVDISVNVPSTYVSGDLLVSALVARTDEQGSITTSTSGWTKITEVNSSGVSLAVFYTFSPNASTVDFAWNHSTNSIASVAHFRVQSSTANFDTAEINSGTSDSPIAPAATMASPNSLVLRFLGTRQKLVAEEGTNMPGYVPVLFRSRALVGPAVGLAHRSFASAGIAPDAEFHPGSSQEFVSATVVFSP